MKYTAMNSSDFNEARKILAGAEKILLGVGAGATASGGLNYADPQLVERWYPDHRALGFSTILEIMGRFWWPEQGRLEEYWAFWANHIFHIRHEPKALEPYRLLYQLLSGKDYFVISTNVDSQLEKAGFTKERMFTPQGNYGVFQCARPCSQALYDNKDMIARMRENMPDPFHVRTEDIPTCPRCGAELVPNLRMDDSFVQEPHFAALPAYRQFIEKSEGKHLVMLELGVGYNTPGIIRFPFEEMTHQHPKSRLIRVNLTDADVSNASKGAGLSFQMDITLFLQTLLGSEAGAAATKSGG